MRHDKLERELDMLLLLTENRGYSVDQICERLHISRRNYYYYLEFFRDCGFLLTKEHGRHIIDRSSPFFKKLIERISFTEDEAIVIRNLVEQVEGKNALVNSIRTKLQQFYDFHILPDVAIDDRLAHLVSQLYDAIKYEKMVVLEGYSSPHGQTRRDRLVEPFLLMNGNAEVRCYEPASGMNKTFKVARMNDVRILADNWQHSAQHKAMHTDIFMFSDEQTHPVEMLLGSLSYHILCEEYPAAKPFLTPREDHRWLLSLDVCSYAGIGRFVLGLYDDIEVLSDQGFLDYLNSKIAAWKVSGH